MDKNQRQDPPASALYAIRYSYDWLRTWRYVIVSSPTKNVGFAAATFSNKRGHRVFPGIKRLMAITGHSKSTVIDALATMRYLGFVWRKSRGQGSEGGLADEYQLSMPRTTDHLPMIDAKSGKAPTLTALPPVAQQTAIRLGILKRLAPEGGTESEPGWFAGKTTLVAEANHWWFSQQTPSTHDTYGSTKSSHHHSDQHDRADAGASAPKYDFDDEDDCYDYIVDHVGDLDPVEGSTVDGMLSNGVHPKAIINKIRADRGYA